MTFLNRVEWRISGRCRYEPVVVVYRPDNGKTRPRLQAILDRYRVPDKAVDDDRRSPEERTLRAKICLHHREHRGVLKELAEIPEIVALEADGN